MNYAQGIQHMQNLSNNKINTSLHSNFYYPLSNYTNLVLKYPGKKQGFGDYKLQHNGNAIEHVDIVDYLYSLAQNNNSQDVITFLLDIYNNGLYANHNVPLNLNNVPLKGSLLTVEQLKYIIFWITLQEDINYPRPSYKGIRLPFARYTEAVIAESHPNIININQVRLRTCNHNGGVPNPITPQGLPQYYVGALGMLK